MGKSLSFSILVPLMFLVANAEGQQPKKTPPKKAVPKKAESKEKTESKIPKEVTDKLAPFVKCVKDGMPPRVIERKPQGFIRARDVSTDVNFGAIESDYADKPYAATITWKATQQESKIYPDREKAEKATEWLPVGKIAGSDNGVHSPMRFTAKLFFSNGEWKVSELEWFADLSGVKNALVYNLLQPNAVISTRGTKLWSRYKTRT